MQDKDQASPENLFGFYILQNEGLFHIVEFSDHSICTINFIDLISIDEHGGATCHTYYTIHIEKLASVSFVVI